MEFVTTSPALFHIRISGHKPASLWYAGDNVANGFRSRDAADRIASMHNMGSDYSTATVHKGA